LTGVGEVVYRKAYDYLKSNLGCSAEELRPYMTGIFEFKRVRDFGASVGWVLAFDRSDFVL
jgi:hypothetical protein